MIMLRKKIVILTSHLPYKDPRVLWFYNSLKQNHDVKFLCTDPYRKPDPASAFYEYVFQEYNPYTPKTIPYLVLTWPFRKVLGLFNLLFKQPSSTAYMHVCYRFLPQMTKVFKELLNEENKNNPIDIIHACDLETLKAATDFKKLHPSVKVIFDAHEFWPEQFVDIDEKYRQFLLNYEKNLIDYIDAYLCVSTPMAEYVNKLYDFNLGIVMPNASPNVDLSKEFITKTNILELAQGRLKFLFQGGFGPERGLEELIEAWASVDPSKAALFLRGTQGNIYMKCVEIARQNNTLDKSVYFLPSISEDELITEASIVDVGVIPYKPSILNHQFACPNKLSQYMQSGIAILASNCPYVAAQVQNGNCGIVFDAFNQSSLVDAINRMIDNPQQLQDYKKNAKMFGSTHYNWDMYFDQIKELYA